MVGLAAVALMLLVGRIAGISGILGGVLRSGDRPWRVAFLAGLILAPAAFALVGQLPDSRIDAGWALLVTAGLLVGIGTRLGAGCTSGQGICGRARLSPRSPVAVRQAGEAAAPVNAAACALCKLSARR